MKTEDTAIVDGVYSLLLAPFTLLWALVPTFVRKQVKTIPKEMVFLVGKVIWTFMFYYWIYCLLSPYFVLPAFMMSAFDRALNFYDLLLSSLNEAYVGAKMISFNVLFPLISAVLGFGNMMLSFKPKKQSTGWFPGLFVPERAMKGSEVIPARELPSFMCFIFGLNSDGERVMLGMGSRVENSILTAGHVLTGYDRILLMSNVAELEVSLDRVVFFHYDDVAFVKMEEREFSILAMSKASLLEHAAPAGTTTYVQCYGPGNPVSFTMGAIETANYDFGKVTYSGTTTHGFSGSPYVVHKQIFGMHLGAGVVNLGVDAAYIRMLLSVIPESTEDWLMDMLEEDMLNKKKIEWRQSPGSPDEIQVKRQGKYFTMDADTFFTVYQQQSAIVRTNVLVGEKLPNIQYNDSKNDALAPACENASAGANGQTSEIKSCAQIEHNLNYPQTPEPIKNGVESLSTEHQVPMHVQPRDHLGYMLKSTNYDPERNRRRQNRKLKRQGVVLTSSTNPGSHGLEKIR